MVTVSVQSSRTEISLTSLQVLFTSLLLEVTGVSRHILVGTDWHTGADWADWADWADVSAVRRPRE